jgi:hypothetical protein
MNIKFLKDEHFTSPGQIPHQKTKRIFSQKIFNKMWNEIAERTCQTTEAAFRELYWKEYVWE